VCIIYTRDDVSKHLISNGGVPRGKWGSLEGLVEFHSILKSMLTRYGKRGKCNASLLQLSALCACKHTYNYQMRMNCTLV
jgi:hypothetical protein